MTTDVENAPSAVQLVFLRGRNSKLTITPDDVVVTGGIVGFRKQLEVWCERRLSGFSNNMALIILRTR